jgi:hypothetical protein
MNHLVIGKGEIGTAIMKVFRCDGVDKESEHQNIDWTKVIFDFTYATFTRINDKYDILHICIPYSEDFIQIVKDYKKKYHAKYVVVHSTVPLGTNKKLGSISSPVLGIHPYLEEGIRTFIKFLGGPKASEIADEFRRAGLRVYIFEKSETTELMKILDTTFYGVCIEYTKDVLRQCKKFNVPFEAWSLWTDNYNQGYTRLNHPEYVRPNLVPIMHKIGGHCIMQNTELLKTKFTEFLKENA